MPLAADWRDWPITPGDWRYRDGTATFADGRLSLRCEGNAVVLAHAALASAATVRTTSLARTIALQPAGAGSAARLPASDPLLDAMGFSRGRFVVEAPGAPPLVVPAWSEVLRVIEDCRR